MKPNYLKFRADVVAEFKEAQCTNTSELDSLDRESISCVLNGKYNISYKEVMNLLHEDMSVANFVKASYKLIK